MKKENSSFGVVCLFFLFSSTNTAQITQQWASTFGGLSPYLIQTDINENVVVSGGSGGGNTVVVKYSSTGNFLWASPYDGRSGSDIVKSMAVDGNGNIYLSVESNGSSSIAFATIKYKPDGSTVWIKEYTAHDTSTVPQCMVMDKDAILYITGRINNYSGFVFGNNSSDLLTIKYDSLGNLLWAERYNDATSANSYESGNHILADEGANVYITGETASTTGGISDIITIKYDSGGNQLWANNYSGTGGVSSDKGWRLGIDGNKNVYVLGQSVLNTNSDPPVLIKYSANGVLQWTLSVNNGTSISMPSNNIVTDNEGNSYVYGTGNLVKYNTLGVQQWVAQNVGGYSGYYNNVSPVYSEAMFLDHCGNIFIAGNKQKSTSPATVMAVSKYSNEGDLLWSDFSDPPPSVYSNDNGFGVIADEKGSIYATGYVSATTDSTTSWTVKYSPPAFNVDFTYEKNCTNAKIVFNGSEDTSIDSWTWNFGDNTSDTLQSSSHIFTTNSTYSVSLTAFKNDCTGSSITKIITGENNSSDIEMPNIFSPNGDGKNDTFRILNPDAPVSEIKVFDRWGKVVFAETNFGDWDGNYKGQPVSEGVYYYTMNYEGCTVASENKTGRFTLFR